MRGEKKMEYFDQRIYRLKSISQAAREAQHCDPMLSSKAHFNRS
jgi:hypothetical protein